MNKIGCLFSIICSFHKTLSKYRRRFYYIRFWNLKLINNFRNSKQISIYDYQLYLSNLHVSIYYSRIYRHIKFFSGHPYRLRGWNPCIILRSHSVRLKLAIMRKARSRQRTTHALDINVFASFVRKPPKIVHNTNTEFTRVILIHIRGECVGAQATPARAKTTPGAKCQTRLTRSDATRQSEGR